MQKGGDAMVLGVGIFGILLGIMMIVIAWTVLEGEVPLTVIGAIFLCSGIFVAIGGYGDMMPRPQKTVVLPSGLANDAQQIFATHPKTTNPFAQQPTSSSAQSATSFVMPSTATL
jgi:hypothetical protein